MPELPEVETVARTLAPQIAGRRVLRVEMRRPDTVRGEQPSAQTLLQGQQIAGFRRHGKQLALVGEKQSQVCVHLGMSGSLCVVADDSKLAKDADPESAPKSDHVHVVWKLEGGRELWFRDPRRFGGLWVFPDAQSLHERRWSKLGPDALRITPKQLHAGLSRTRRALKAALLDQNLVAGLGNIYVDELLFTTRLHPRKMAVTVTSAESQRLVRAMRRILGRAIDAGGSTLRDYVDATGQAGGYQTKFKAYGRGGQPCSRCGLPLDTLIVAGRTTSACGACQTGASPI